MLGALIGAGASLLGGVLGRKAERKGIAAQNAYNDPAAVRARFEAAGFNPLLGIQPGVGMQAATGGANYIGAGISDAITSVADAWSENASQKAEAEALQAENEKLRRQVQVDTIRPRVGGLYDRPQGERISISAPRSGWIPEWEADFAGKRVMAGPFGAGSDAYYGKNNERTVITTPMGDTSPANSSDAEDWEKRYGDPVSWAVGLGTLAMDTGNSMRRYTDANGWTDPDENLLTDTAPRLFKDSLGRWRKWSKSQRKKGGTGNDGFGIRSGAYEGWMQSTFGEGHFN